VTGANAAFAFLASLRDSLFGMVFSSLPDTAISASPSRPPRSAKAAAPHLFDDPEYSGARQGPVGVTYGPECRSFFVGERVFPAVGGPHAVDLAAVVFAQERTRLLAELTATFLVRCQIRFSKRLCRQVQVLGDPFGIGAGDLDVEGLAAVGTTGAIDHLEGPLVQFGSKFVGIEAVIPKLQAAEKLVVLVALRLGVPLPVLNYRVVIHVVFLKHGQDTA
jgi:hypothetical protein